METVDYYGLGEQDDQLKTEVESLVAKHNAKGIGPTLAYGPYVEDPEDEDSGCFYWGIYPEGAPSDLSMFVVYDDQSWVDYSEGSAEGDLFEAVLDAMQSCADRQDFGQPFFIRMD